MDIHEDINAIVEKVYDAMNRHDSEGLAMLAADDVVVEDIPTARVAKGRQAVVEHYRRAFLALPDVEYRSLSRIRQADTIVDEWALRGTHKGEVTIGKLTIKPTNKVVELRGVSIMQLRGGYVRRHRLYYDSQAFQRQLGAPGLLKTREAGSKDCF